MSITQSMSVTLREVLG